jgi:SAM-dependent methyltransferase
MVPRVIARQLSRPTGLLGAVIRRLMNRGNARMNALAVRELALSRADRVLEIGFGGGVSLPGLLKQAASVTGLDRSADVIARARVHFAREVASGRLDFREGVVESLPFAAGAFDKACTVNTVYFWRSLDEGFAEIHRVLAPGGRLAVGFLPKERMDTMGFPADIFTPRDPADVIAALSKAGFAKVRVERPAGHDRWNVVVAER